MQQYNIKEHEVCYPFGSKPDNIENFKEACKSFLIVVGRSISKDDRNHINIICRGSSGAMTAILLYEALNTFLTKTKTIKIVHVKKNGEHSHCGTVSSTIEKKHINIFVDDFALTCSTIIETHKAICNDIKNEDFKFDYLFITYYWASKVQILKDVTNNIIGYCVPFL